jgi:hypothetical protein
MGARPARSRHATGRLVVVAGRRARRRVFVQCRTRFGSVWRARAYPGVTRRALPGILDRSLVRSGDAGELRDHVRARSGVRPGGGAAASRPCAEPMVPPYRSSIRLRARHGRFRASAAVPGAHAGNRLGARSYPKRTNPYRCAPRRSSPYSCQRAHPRVYGRLPARGTESPKPCRSGLCPPSPTGKPRRRDWSSRRSRRCRHRRSRVRREKRRYSCLVWRPRQQRGRDAPRRRRGRLRGSRPGGEAPAEPPSSGATESSEDTPPPPSPAPLDGSYFSPSVGGQVGPGGVVPLLICVLAAGLILLRPSSVGSRGLLASCRSRTRFCSCHWSAPASLLPGVISLPWEDPKKANPGRGVTGQVLDAPTR